MILCHVIQRLVSHVSHVGKGVSVVALVGMVAVMTGCAPADDPTDVGMDTFSLQLDLTGFSPHLSQKIEARVVDVGSDEEVDRVTATGAVDVTLFFSDVLAEGRSYRVDFYADFDTNEEYTPPVGGPAASFPDHQWRISGESDVDGASGLADVAADVLITFPHDANWIDIDWPGAEGNGGTTEFSLMLDLTGFVPHDGQRIEGRVVAVDDDREVARVDVVGATEVSLDFGRVLAQGGSYRIDFYADLDMNDEYTPPVGDPAASFPDHQWRISGESDAEGAEATSERCSGLRHLGRACARAILMMRL